MSRGFVFQENIMKIAIMVDGAFFLKRAKYFWGSQNPQAMADILYKYCKSHVRHAKTEHSEGVDLYRIFYYDCPPANIKIHHPITNAFIRYGESTSANWRNAFHNELKQKRKVALRLGRIDEENPSWTISGQTTKDLCSGKINVCDLEERDVRLDFRQKGVDMRIGLDIASITFKQQANQIILISGDSDFVPAAKLSRREGIDFVLDSMKQRIKDDLFEHIDGLYTEVNDDGSVKHPLPEAEKQKIREFQSTNRNRQRKAISRTKNTLDCTTEKKFNDNPPVGKKPQVP
jgi:uncharacterized LabA/DUF88 family protein